MNDINTSNNGDEREDRVADNESRLKAKLKKLFGNNIPDKRLSALAEQERKRGMASSVIVEKIAEDLSRKPATNMPVNDPSTTNAVIHQNAQAQQMPSRQPEDTKKGVEAFEYLVGIDKDLKDSSNITSMLIRLLRNYQNSEKGMSILEKMNLDYENLKNILLAGFGHTIGRNITQDILIDWIKQSKNPGLILYSDVFGFEKDASEKTIKIKSIVFIEMISKFSALHKFAFTQLPRGKGFGTNITAINKALEIIKQNPPKDEETLMRILREEGVPINNEPDEIIFDAPTVTKMLNELHATYQPPKTIAIQLPQDEETLDLPQTRETVKKVVQNVVLVKSDIEALRVSSDPDLRKAIEYLDEIESAFRVELNEYQSDFIHLFGGKPRREVVSFMQKAFLEASFGTALFNINKSANETILTLITKKFNLGDLESIAIKVKEIHRIFSAEWPDVVKEPIEEPMDESDELGTSQLEVDGEMDESDESEADQPEVDGEMGGSDELGTSQLEVDGEMGESDELGELDQPETEQSNILESQEALSGPFKLNDDDDDDEL